MTNASSPSWFPLPDALAVGSQTWTITCFALRMRSLETVRLALILNGPHGRTRRIRVTFPVGALLRGRFATASTLAAIERWLPHSDGDDVLDLPAAALHEYPDARENESHE